MYTGFSKLAVSVIGHLASPWSLCHGRPAASNQDKTRTYTDGAGIDPFQDKPPTSVFENPLDTAEGPERNLPIFWRESGGSPSRGSLHRVLSRAGLRCVHEANDGRDLVRRKRWIVLAPLRSRSYRTLNSDTGNAKRVSSLPTSQICEAAAGRERERDLLGWMSVPFASIATTHECRGMGDSDPDSYLEGAGSPRWRTPRMRSSLEMRESDATLPESMWEEKTQTWAARMHRARVEVRSSNCKLLKSSNSA
ncbi:hypothetical protein V8D89_008864, partial [Ganoderma adspersum]